MSTPGGRATVGHEGWTVRARQQTELSERSLTPYAITYHFHLELISLVR